MYVPLGLIVHQQTYCPGDNVPLGLIVHQQTYSPSDSNNNLDI